MTCAWPSCCSGCARRGAEMLTDYHVHLRPDDDGTLAEDYFTPANAERYREPRPSAASPSWASPSTSTASPRRWTSGSTRSGGAGARRPRRLLRLRARGDRPAARDRGRLHRRPRGPHGQPARRARLRLRRRVGALPRRRGRSTCRASTTSGAAAVARADLAALLRDAGRSGAQRPVRHHGPPRPGQDLGRRPPAAGPRPAPLLRAGRRGLRRRRGRGRALDRRPAQAGRGDLPGAGVPGDRRGGGLPVALSSDAHVPDQLGHGYDQAVELLEAVGITELAVFDRRERRLEPIG